MGGAPKSPGRAARRPTILVAEDDGALRKMLGHMLGELGDVHLAEDGMQALTTLKGGEVDPDLVITDVMMPRMDGLTLAQRIKMDDKLSRIPVIMLTAKGGPKDVITGINAGARHYITKPFKKEELVAKVKKVLRLP